MSSTWAGATVQSGVLLTDVSAWVCNGPTWQPLFVWGVRCPCKNVYPWSLLPGDVCLCMCSQMLSQTSSQVSPCWYLGASFQWFQGLFSHHLLVHAHIKPHYTQDLFALPCCLQFIILRHSALDQGKVVGLPSHIPLWQWRQTVWGWIRKSLSWGSRHVIMLYGDLLGHTWTIMSSWSSSSSTETLKIKADLLNGQHED